MSRILAIDEITRQRIASLIERAQKRPVPFDAVRNHAAPPGTKNLSLKDRKPGLVRPQSAHIDIPFGYTAAFSIEEQPNGLVRHLSISVDTVGRCPNEAAVAMIAEAFGMMEPFDAVWLEEFDPGHHAVNVLKLVAPRTEGHA
jgi:hypothetical protein